MQQRSHTVATRLLLTALLVCSHLTAWAAKPLPVSAFVSLPLVTDARLSPSGKYVAFFFNHEGKTVLATRNPETGAQTGIIQTDNSKFVFNWLEWANDERLIFSVYYPARRYGVATGETRLMSAARDGSDTKVLVKPRDMKKGRSEHLSQFYDRVISFLPDDPEHILLALDTEKMNLPEVWKVNVHSGTRKRIQRHKSPIRSWITDQQGNVRAGTGYDQKTAVYSAWVRRPNDKQWETMWEYEALSAQSQSLLGFGQDPAILYISADHEGRRAIYTLDTTTPNFKRELLLHDSSYDIDGELVYSSASNDVIGVEYPHTPGGVLYLDKDAEAFQNALDDALPDTANYIANTSRDEMQYLVFASNDNRSGSYFLGNRKKASLGKLAEQYPDLVQETLSGKQLIRYKARDGLEIEGFLSLPVTGPTSSLPTIIFPHGGPMSRDYGGFDYWTQFFTNRGYAVLQPNFRGSSGYGTAFMMAAVKRYGLAMQDDLEDGARWLAEEGISDLKRICIAGASYGGYAALVGVVKTPDFYQCAISFAGISSLIDVRNQSSKYLGKNIVRKQVGTDSEQLKITSPLYHADKVKVPILLAHGDRDRVVPVSHSQKMAKALKKARKNVTYLELEQGSHSLHRQENRTELFEVIDRFLAQHLPVEK